MILFIFCLALFLAGLYLFGLAFSVTVVPGLVFIAGLALVSLAIAIPMHMLKRI